MKVNFDRKCTYERPIPQDEFVIERMVKITVRQFDKFIRNTLDDYSFIKENKDLMRTDSNGVWHCIFVYTSIYDFGILVQSDGKDWACNSAYLSIDEIDGCE